jgi:uncharacterized repeat protein (TIGR03803 family)
MRLLWTAVLVLPALAAQAGVVLTSLHSFQQPFLNGANPEAGLVQGSDGYFYGTTSGGGAYTNQYGQGYGTVFKITPDGALTSLYSFSGGDDGAYPGSALVQASDGYFYGTADNGGINDNGTVFKISANGALTSLHLFTGGNDGGAPEAGLVQGSDGNLYGTTSFGGNTHLNYSSGDGTVFKISTNGALTSLHRFTAGNDGATPVAGLVQGSDGYFYGTTRNGSTVFKISTNGALTTLHSFTGGNDGVYPSGLVQGSDGNMYGTTESYGAENMGPGTVFKISTNGALTTLHSFTGGTDGAYPAAGLVQGSDGYFYGTTGYGGTNRFYGTVFKISANGALTTLYSFGSIIGWLGNGFTIALDGANPAAGLVQGSDGNFYGTTKGGGTSGLSITGFGTVFKISTNGALTTLYAFGTLTDANRQPLDGLFPGAALLQGSDGNFYGTTSATVFQMTPAGVLTTLVSGFVSPSALVQGRGGNLYGTTADGGNTNLNYGSGYGTVFKITTNGALTSLYSFTGGNDGSMPNGLVQGSDGNFYGTTSGGGAGGAGTVFRLTIVPEFQAVTLTNSTLSLTWTAEAGRRYQLQYNSDLSSSNWTNLTNAVTAAGATLSTTDSVTNAPRRFYRLVLLP